MSIDIDGLRGFVVVSELGAFQDAALALNVSPSALTRRIQKLEESLETVLLDRTTRRVSLTSFGRDFLPKAKRILEDIDSAVQSMHKTGARGGGLVTVSCIPSAVGFFLPRVIAAFSATFPQTRVRILEESASLVVHRVLNAQSDVGITFLGAGDSEIEFDRMTEDPYLLACHRDHPLAAQRVVSWQDLKSYRFISPNRLSGNRLEIDRALRGSKWVPNWSYEVRLSSALGLIASNLAVAAMPRMAMPEPSYSVVVGRPLVDPVVIRTIGIVRRKTANLSRAATSFLECLNDHIVVG